MGIVGADKNGDRRRVLLHIVGSLERQNHKGNRRVEVNFAEVLLDLDKRVFGFWKLLERRDNLGKAV